jgi:hypothetical protein
MEDEVEFTDYWHIILQLSKQNAIPVMLLLPAISACLPDSSLLL